MTEGSMVFAVTLSVRWSSSGDAEVVRSAFHGTGSLSDDTPPPLADKNNKPITLII